MATGIQRLKRDDVELIPMTDKTEIAALNAAGITGEDAEFLCDIIKNVDNKEVIDMKIPEDITLEQFDYGFKLLSTAHDKWYYAKELTKPMIARMMTIMLNRPDLMMAIGCENHTQFLNTVAPKRYGVSRSLLWGIYQFSKQWEDFNPSIINTIGIDKLSLISRAVPLPKKADESVRQAVIKKRRELLPITQGATYRQIVDKLDAAGVAPKTFLLPSIIKIKTDVETVKLWDSFVNNKDVHERCGTSDPSVIFGYAIQECFSVWALKADNTVIDYESINPGE